MSKTDRQQLLELQRGKPIRALIEEALAKHRGKNCAILAALDLDISVSTLNNWAAQFEIDLKNFGSGEDALPVGATKA